jgi:hypothetical protein
MNDKASGTIAYIEFHDVDGQVVWIHHLSGASTITDTVTACGMSNSEAYLFYTNQDASFSGKLVTATTLLFAARFDIGTGT